MQTRKAELNFLTRFIINSELIEGIEENGFDTRNALALAKKKGHVGALLLLRKKAANQGFLSEDDILKVQGLITQEQPEKGVQALPTRLIGHYRDCGVSVSGATKPIPSKVPGLMKSFIRRVEHWQKVCDSRTEGRNIATVANFHFEFEHCIHPFADGNGRTGRALAYFMLSYAAIPPFIFTNHGREYYSAFASAEDMRRYFFSRYENCSLDPTLLNLDFRQKS